MQTRTAAVIDAATHAGIGAAGVRVTSVGLTPEYETDRQGQPLYLHVRRWTKNAVESYRSGAFVDGAFAPGQMSISSHVDVVFGIGS